MPAKIEREYRSVAEFRAIEGNEYIVEGYASTFETYFMFEIDGANYYERIEPTAFVGADMRDIIMQYDHEGMVYARISNGSLKVDPDEKGLHITADLSRTKGARELYESIKTGMVNQMSFAFTVENDHFEKDTRTRVIDKIKKVYDVSAVSIPANPTTTIAARSYFDGVIEMERAERLAARQKEQRIRKIKIIAEVNNGI